MTGWKLKGLTIWERGQRHLRYGFSESRAAHD